MENCIKEQQMGLFADRTSALLVAQSIPIVIIELGVSAYEWYSAVGFKKY
jgi:hypothetical protein